MEREVGGETLGGGGGHGARHGPGRLQDWPGGHERGEAGHDQIQSSRLYQVSRDVAMAKAIKLGARFMETSSKSGEKVDALFEEVASTVLDRKRQTVGQGVSSVGWDWAAESLRSRVSFQTEHLESCRGPRDSWPARGDQEDGESPADGEETHQSEEERPEQDSQTG